MTTTFGTGELIRAALDLGCRKIILGIGGSATNEGGAGMAQALGFSFKDEHGAELGFGGSVLGKLCTIDCTNGDQRLKDCEIIAACDVNNTLCGKNGASHVFESADLVITGEGKIDYQSAFGKVPVGIAKRAKQYGVPVIAVVGSIGDGAETLMTME